MKPKRTTYRAAHIPAAGDSLLEVATPGGVHQGVHEGFEHLLNTTATFPAGAASLSLTSVFTPSDRPEEKQARLRLDASVGGTDERTRRALSLALEQGSLSQLYGLKADDFPEIPWDCFQVACDIHRRETEIAPLFSAEHNAQIPTVLYQNEAFIANPDADGLFVDRILDKITEHVVIQICVESVDLARERSAIGGFLARLQAINRPWDDESLLREQPDYFGIGGHRYNTSDRELRLPRQRDPEADAALRNIQDLRKALRVPHLLFHFRVLAETLETALLVSSALAQSAFRDGAYTLELTSRKDHVFDEALTGVSEGRVTLVPSLGARLEEKEPRLYRDLDRLAHMATPGELLGAFRWPVGSCISPCCIPQSTDPPIVPREEMIMLGFDSPHVRGPFMPTLCGIPRGLLKRNARKGLAFIGKPGFGKTMALVNLMLQLFADGIGFVFFAPISGEQSIIKKYVNHSDPLLRGLARALRVFTPGRDDVAPLQFNPLKRNPRVLLHQHIDGLMECFKGAIPFFPALEGLLRDALYLIYRRYPNPDHPPVMRDLLSAAREIVAHKGYQGELLNNLRAAIETRLGGLCEGAIGSIFNLGVNNPEIQQLPHGYYLIELDALSEEQQTLFMLFYLKALREHISACPRTDKYLLMAILIDEAHRLAGVDTNAVQSEERSNPKAYASRSVCRLLAEFRKRRVCMALADQSPSAIAPDVLQMTGTQLASCVTEEADRDRIGGAMLFGNYEREQIARLVPGQAFLFTEGFHKSRLITTVDLSRKIDYDSILTPQDLHDLICSQPWYRETRLVSESARLERLAQESDRLDVQRTPLVHQVARFCHHYAHQRANRADTSGTAAEARRLKHRFETLIRDFRYGPYRELLGHDDPSDPTTIKEIRACLRHQFENVVLPDTHQCMETLTKIINGARRRHPKGGSES